jgi:hypothetical protein
MGRLATPYDGTPAVEPFATPFDGTVKIPAAGLPGDAKSAQDLLTKQFPGEEFKNRGGRFQELLSVLAYREYAVVTDGVKQPVIDTDPVARGSFWYVMAGSVTLLPGAAGALLGGVFLMPPELKTAAGPESSAATVHTSFGVQVNTPNPTSSDSIAGGAKSLLLNGIVVPPGWFLRWASDNSGVAPAAGIKIGFFLAYAELPLSFDALELLLR